MNLKVQGQGTEFIIDTGSSINIIDINVYNQLADKPALRSPICNAYRFDSDKPINFLGRFTTTVGSREGSVEAEIHVLKHASSSPSILSYKTATALGVIQFVQTVSQDVKREEMRAVYPHLFSGEIGCLKDFELELYEDPSVKPSKQFHYRIPYHLQPRVKEHLDHHESKGLIEKATGPTTWISSSHVIPKKNGDFRLVIDGRPVNKAIIRHRHITPTLDDVAVKLLGAKFFSKVDLQDAYKQIVIAPKSRHLTVFSTHMGLYRDMRLRPGTNAAAENFQWIVQEKIKHLLGVINVSDDIIVHGKTQEEHDANLHALLKRLQALGFTANLRKCEFDLPSIDFFGVSFSARGMAPSDSRVAAFQLAEAPNSASELRSILAIANYSARFINNFAKIIAPLRDLAKEDAQPFGWLPEHDEILAKLKAAFTTNSLAYFNSDWNTEVICDASPHGLGAILVQSNPTNPAERGVIAFASRTLSLLEKKYSQVEREALALIFGVERFHQYVYGKKFKLYSDAKAIVFIYGNTNHKSPARIERWGLRLLPYDFELVHTAGDGNPADYLSRHPIDPAAADSDDVDLYVNFIIDNSVPRAVTRNQIAKATANDPELQLLIQAIRSSNRQVVRKNRALSEYNSVFDQLSVSSDDIVLRNHQIVVPESLRKTMVDIAHEGHLGIVKTKQLMRLKVWFPRLDHLVATKIGNCLACQACTPANSKNMIPLQSEPVPDSVWHTVAGDFFGPLPSGHYLLSLVCKTSGYPIVEVVTSTSAKANIPVLDRVFSEFGIPAIFCSDNGPPFQSKDVKGYCDYMGIEHQKSTPYWPRGNAKCERFMKSLGKIVRIAQVEGKPWRQVMNQFLRSYRAAPHASTGFSPNQLMFARNVSSRLPNGITPAKSVALETALTNYANASEANRLYADKKLNTKPSLMKPGDLVLVKQPKVNKLTAPYKPEKLVVVARDKSWILAKSPSGHTVERNISFFKLLPPDPPELPEEEVTTLSDEESPLTDQSIEQDVSLAELSESDGGHTIEFGTPHATQDEEYTRDNYFKNPKVEQQASSPIDEPTSTPHRQPVDTNLKAVSTPTSHMGPAETPSKHSRKKASSEKKRAQRATRNKDPQYRLARSYTKRTRLEAEVTEEPGADI